MKYKEWLIYAKNFLKKNNIIDYQYESEILLEFVIKIKLKNIIIHEENILKYKHFLILEKALNMRKKKIPIHYIIKKIEFYSILFLINNKIFIPRFDTECLIDYVLNRISNINYNIIDLGTGIGSIAIALAKNIPNSHVIGIDINKEAIKIAKINSKILKLNNIFFYKKNWFNFLLNKKFDIIISNPPYVSKNEFKIYKNKIINEPIDSIISKNNGLYDIKYIIKNFKKNLSNNGFIIIEHGYTQGNEVRNIFDLEKYKNINTYFDFSKNERFTVAEK